MPDYDRDGRSLLLGERKELRRKLAQRFRFERNIVCGSETIEDRKQNQRVFERLPQRISAFNECARLFEGGFGVARRVAFGVHPNVGKPDLQLDLLSSQGRRTRQGGNLGQRAAQLRLGLHERRTRYRSLTLL